MSNKDVLIFLAGGAVGSLVTYFLVKDYYEKEAEATVQEMREYLDASCKYDGSSTDDIPEKKSENKIIELGNVNKQHYHSESPETVDYTKFYKGDKTEKEEQEDDISEKEEEMKQEKKGPYVIWANQFEEDDNYSKETLTYFTDGKVADAGDEVIPNGIDLIGADNLDRFGEEEENIMYIRNEDMCVDYEVVLEERTFEDYINS